MIRTEVGPGEQNCGECHAPHPETSMHRTANGTFLCAGCRNHPLKTPFDRADTLNEPAAKPDV